MKQVHYYFDFMSPYAYLACTQIPLLVNRYQGIATFKGHSFDMWQARLASGNNGPSNREMPARMRVLMADVARWAKRYDVPIAPPKGFDTARLNRAFLMAADKGAEVAFMTAVFGRLWGAGGDPADESMLVDSAKDAGLNGEDLLAAADSDVAVARYAAENEDAQRIGIFGAPMFVVDDQFYWGNDRIEWLEEYLREDAVSLRAAG